jgi:thioredoxin-related protein
MKISKYILLLLLSSSLFAEDNASFVEMISSPPQNNSIEVSSYIYDENLSRLVIPAPVIDEKYLFELASKEENRTSSSFLDYNEALKIAKESHKKILLEVISTNCKFCIKMGEEVLAQERVQNKIRENFVLAQVNMDQESLPLGLSEQMTPMFVFISENEDIEDMRFGYMDEHEFILLLELESR